MMTLKTSKEMCIKEMGGGLIITCDNFFTTLFDVRILKPGQHITPRPLQLANYWLRMG